MPIAGTTTTPGWLDEAACRDADPETFFPIGEIGPAAAEIRRAKAVCAGCAVRAVCLTWALGTGQEFGVWGGRTESERRAMQVVPARIRTLRARR